MEKTARIALKRSLGIPPERRVVIYLGLLAPYQGTDHLLEAAAIIRNEWGMRDVHFLVMGFPGVDSYRAQADILGLNNHVLFPGRIAYADAPRYLALGDVAVAPKLSVTEGAGKIGNYMAMGLPVVAYDTEVSREYMGPLGVYAERGNSRDLARKLVLVLEHPTRYKDVGAQLRQHCVTNFSWAASVSKIEQVYKQAGLRRRGKSGHVRAAVSRLSKQRKR
jgi:glycosyltransferase involved in cell wall biosynthesis